MSTRALKTQNFITEGINSFATFLYFGYLFFFIREQFGFGNLGCLALGALNGLIYVPGSLYAGRFAQRHGYFTALKLGCGGLAGAMALGAAWQSVTGQVLTMVLWTFFLCFTWPTLEAIASEGESPQQLPRTIGIYNVVWAGTSALAYFSGGAILERVGWKGLFWLPAGMHLVQLVIIFSMEKSASGLPLEGASIQPDASAERPQPPVSRAGARSFQRMAWMANPFAYFAINTAIPLLPDLARRLDLSATEAGFFCSVWMFSRVATFFLLWHWPRWHYRFGWLFAAFGLLVLSFSGLLVLNQPALLVACQLVFGWAVGLIYYSSLFYSMDASETKGVHGGVHEAAIGLGIFGGPAVGAVAAYYFPNQANVSTWAVSAVLLLGLVALPTLRRRG